MNGLLANLIAALIGAIPGLVVALENFFIENPRLAGETDEAYAERINLKTKALAEDTSKANATAGAGDDGGIMQTPGGSS